MPEIKPSTFAWMLLATIVFAMLAARLRVFEVPTLTPSPAPSATSGPMVSSGGSERPEADDGTEFRATQTVDTRALFADRTPNQWVESNASIQQIQYQQALTETPEPTGSPGQVPSAPATVSLTPLDPNTPLSERRLSLPPITTGLTGQTQIESQSGTQAEPQAQAFQSSENSRPALNASDSLAPLELGEFLPGQTLTGQTVPGQKVPDPGITDAFSQDDRTLPRDQANAIVTKAEGANISLRLNNEELRNVLEMISLESGLSILPSEGVTGKVSANITNVSSMQALQAILFSTGYQIQHRDGFVFVGSPEDFVRMERVSQIPETRVYRPCFVSASELKQLVESLLTPTLGNITITSAAPQGLAVNTGGAGGGVTLGGDPNANGGGQNAGPLGANYTGNDILVIHDLPTVLARVDTVIRQVDVPPLQVAIEALILSVSLDDRHRLGVNLELLKGDGVRVVSGSMPGGLDNLETGQGLLSLGFLEANVGSFIAALDDIGETNVIAAPHVLALNKMSAEILIGEQIGFANTTVTQTAATQSIQFLDVGTQLQIRPHVNDEGLIRLEIHPEVSQGTVRSVGNLALPEKTVTQVTTNVMCRDNETIVIGGLIREEIDDAHRGVPLLGKLPVMGPFFRSRQRNTKREELLVLLTPHVIRDPADALPDHRVVEGFVDRRAQSIEPERKNWVIRKKEADRYYNLAANAWKSGNQIACRRYLEICLDIDPRNEQALSLWDHCLRESALENYGPPSDRSH